MTVSTRDPAVPTPVKVIGTGIVVCPFVMVVVYGSGLLLKPVPVTDKETRPEVEPVTGTVKVPDEGVPATKSPDVLAEPQLNAKVPRVCPPKA